MKQAAQQVDDRKAEHYQETSSAKEEPLQLTKNESVLIYEASQFGIPLMTKEKFWRQLLATMILDELDMKWKVDGIALAQKLRGMSPWQYVKLFNEVKTFWK